MMKILKNTDSLNHMLKFKMYQDSKQFLNYINKDIYVSILIKLIPLTTNLALNDEYK